MADSRIYYPADADMSDPEAWPERFKDKLKGHVLAAHMWEVVTRNGFTDYIRDFDGNIYDLRKDFRDAIEEIGTSDNHSGGTMAWTIAVVSALLRGELYHDPPDDARSE